MNTEDPIQGPYIPYFDEKSRWWKLSGPTQVDAGWTRQDHAQSHADDLNAAYHEGQRSGSGKNHEPPLDRFITGSHPWNYEPKAGERSHIAPIFITNLNNDGLK